MAIASRDLPVGTRLVARSQGRLYHLSVVKSGAGQRRFRLMDGRHIGSPADAGRALRGDSGGNARQVGSPAEAAAATSRHTAADTGHTRARPGPCPERPHARPVRRPRRTGR